MSRSARAACKLAALAGLPALFILHDDFWLWDDPRFLLGLPIGLTYHVLYCLAATCVMFLLVTFAWPAHLEVVEDVEDVEVVEVETPGSNEEPRR